MKNWDEVEWDAPDLSEVFPHEKDYLADLPQGFGLKGRKMTKHAVVDDHNDYYRITSQDESLVEYAPDIWNLYHLMVHHHIDVLWAMPGCSFSRNIRREHFDALNYDTYVPEHLVKNRVHGARVGKKHFMFPENREWKQPQHGDKGVWKVETAHDLLATVGTLEQEYKVPILWGPSHVGFEVLRSIQRFGGVEPTPLGGEQQREFLTLARAMAAPVSWGNLHTRGKWIVGVDKNGQFLGAAQSVKLGSGAYVKAENYGPNQAAFWRYEAGALGDGPLSSWILPKPLPPTGWASTDLIEAARKMGMWVETHEGITWKESGKYLETWAKEMWVHRSNLSTWANPRNAVFDNAASTAKMIPNTMIGRFKKEGFPHWNMGIIHRAIANQAYTLMRLYRDEEIAPILVSKDALYFVTDAATPQEACPGLLEHPTEQRGYKLIGVCEMTNDIVAAFERINDKRFGVGGVEGVIKGAMKV